MPRFEQRDKDGNLTGFVTVDENKLKADPTLVIKVRGPKGSQPGQAPDGYEHVTSQDGDPDSMIADCTVHFYAKKGSYEREKLPAVAAARAVETKTVEAPKV